MAAPTVIKWTDPGAPMLSRVAGSFIAILEYCLLQRGWEKVWHVGNRAVFRASAGNRKFFRVLNDDSFYYSSTNYLYCSALQFMYAATAIREEVRDVSSNS